jgi:hypothetical protein
MIISNNGLLSTLVKCLSINLSGHIFSGTYNGIYRSTDNGENWFSMNNGLSFTNVYSIAINLLGHIFAGTFGGGIFRSTDNGENWIEINNGLTHLYIHSLTINTLGNIYAGTSQRGAFQSTDNGNTWTEINTGLTDNFIKSLAINSSGYIFAGTLTKGVFRSINSTITFADNSITTLSTFSLAQNYPNPFNPATTIKYQIPELSFVTLKVYDVLGGEIATLVNEEKPAGGYEVEFNKTELPSGIYFYRLQADNYIETRKMVLMK